MDVVTVLETERLRLTNWIPDHINDLVTLHVDPLVARYLTVAGEPETPAQAKVRLEHWAELFDRHRMGKLRVTRKGDDSFVGRAGFGIYPPTDEPEIGYALLRSEWGKGYAHEAAAGLRDWYFRETDRDHFIGYADVRNEKSLRTLRSIGMIPTHVENESRGGLKCQFHIFRRSDWLG